MIPNLIGREWAAPASAERLPVYDPATGEVIDEVPLSGPAEVDRAVAAAARAYATWSRTPVMDRAALLFRYKALLEEHAEQLARIVTRHHGKTLDEARGEVRRGIEVVDFACGMPTLMQGRTLRQVSAGVDQDMYRFPVGVVAGITPFNFPVMIPLWMLPLAVTAGNTFVLKPSERTPLGAVRLAELFLEAGFPEGVLNVVHGGREAVDALLSHPDVRAVSFVGSEPAARHVYAEAARHRKRVQAAGGAKNHIVVMPDADLPRAVQNVCDSIFGCAGQRCLAGSIVVGVGEAYGKVRDGLVAAARAIRVGNGAEPGVTMGPVISSRHKDRVLSYVDVGVKEGARLLLDGRELTVPSLPDGNWVGPTIFEEVRPEMTIAREEIFGPVVCLMRAEGLDEAIALVNASEYGNASSIYTSSGKHARAYKLRAAPGMIGVNVGIAAPMAFFPFGGAKGSFFGDTKANGDAAVDFYTEKKVVITRWF